MGALDARGILKLWEAARDYHPVDQALALLAAAEPGQSPEALATLTLGQRDARLIALRQVLVGDLLKGSAACPQCQERVEFEISSRTLQNRSGEIAEQVLECEGYILRLRSLNSHDLAAAVKTGDVAAARRTLLQRCVVEARRKNAPADVGAIPEDVIASIGNAVLAADPQAELLVELSCPACPNRWKALLDIVHILWLEIAARAQRLLMEVHLLAREYGWRESDILEMSPARRAGYLRLVSL